MEKIKSLKVFETSEQEFTDEAEEFLDECVKGTWKYDPRSKRVSVDGDVDCSFFDLKDFFGIQFSFVSGDFDCSNNDLKSLKGCPEKVGKSFDCSDNLLEDLEGGPTDVGLNYDCSANKLKSLSGVPERIFGKFDCNHNRLESLKGCPREIFKTLDCSHNKLKTLEGCPDLISKHLNCSNNKLESFKNFPAAVRGNLNASNNSITGFSDYNTEINGNLDVSSNKIQSLVGLSARGVKSLNYDGNEVKLKDKTLFNDLFNSMKQTGLKLEDAILLKGVNFKPSLGTGMRSYIELGPDSYEKLPEDKKIANIKTLMEIVATPKEAYSIIQKNPEGPAITSLIRNKLPDIWEKMKDLGRAKLSADMGDLFF